LVIESWASIGGCGNVDDDDDDDGGVVGAVDVDLTLLPPPPPQAFRPSAMATSNASSRRRNPESNVFMMYPVTAPQSWYRVRAGHTAMPPCAHLDTTKIQ
jgi:hypothetical protein